MSDIAISDPDPDPDPDPHPDPGPDRDRDPDPDPGPDPDRDRDWRWFAAWAVPGACFGSAVSVLVIFTGPIGVALVVALGRRRSGPDALGLIAGVGAMVTGIGAFSLTYAPPVVGLVAMIAGIGSIVFAVLAYRRATWTRPQSASACASAPSRSGWRKA